jgi:hypothetical protein
MNKNSLLLSLLVLAFVFFGTNSFALIEDDNTNEGASAGESIKLTDGLDPENTLVLNFSPSVNAIYEADTADDGGNKQWYAVATYHSGGTNFYASSSDSTGIYKQTRESSNVFADVTIPTSKTMTTGTGTEAVTQSAEEYWLDNDWEK